MGVGMGDGGWGIGDGDGAGRPGESLVHESRFLYSATSQSPIPNPHLPAPNPHSPSPSMRLGFRYVKGLREEAARAIVRERAKRPFEDIDDLHNRVLELRKDELRKLAAVGALNFINCGNQRSEVNNRQSSIVNLFIVVARSGRWNERLVRLDRCSKNRRIRITNRRFRL